jgi:hypothetical protein
LKKKGRYNRIMDNIINFLLNHAGATIVYRVKNEVLKSSDSSDIDLQKAILKERDIASIISAARPDGWLGLYFHTRFKGAMPFQVFEVALRYLAEKGVDLSHDAFSGAARAYLTRNVDDPVYENSGRLGYDYTCMGLWLIRGSGIARIGYEDRIDISKEIDTSLASFFNVLNYNSISDIVIKNRKGQYYFKEKLLWPCIYHLKILAYTYSWRTKDNIKLLASCVDKLLSFDVFEPRIYTKINNYYASPCDAFTYNLIESFDNETVGPWLDKMELFSRCGISKYSKKFKAEVGKLKATINESDISEISIDERYFKNWSAYSGLKLEESWRSNIKKLCDINFRILLILYYSDK